MQDRELILNLNELSLDAVREKFNLPLWEAKRHVRTPVDVLMKECGKEYRDAVKLLAEAFPSIANGSDIITPPAEKSPTAYIMGTKLEKKLAKMVRMALKQLQVLGLERLTINVKAKNPRESFSTGTEYPEGITIGHLLKMFPYLASHNVRGSDIYFQGHHRSDRVSLYIDDVEFSFCDEHRPSLLLETSDRSMQAHYVLEKKYDDKFYHYATAWLNKRYGDPAVTKANHNTRLAGFSNRKLPMLDGSGRFPYVEIKSATRMRCISLEKLLDEMYVRYSNNAIIKDVAEEFDLVPVPAEVERGALAYQKNIILKYGSTIDRSRADVMLGCYLYAQGVTEEVVFSWLMRHATQKDKHNAKNLKRYASRTALYCKKKDVAPFLFI